MATTGRIQVAPGQTISSSTFGNAVWDQSINCFASTADRDTQWPSPHEGSHCVTVDTGSRWVYRSGAWHGIPMGYVAQIVGPATQINCGSTLTQLITFSPVLTAGRLYRVYAYGIGTNTGAGIPRIDITGLDRGTFRMTPGIQSAVNGVFGASGVGLVTPSTSGARAITMFGTSTVSTFNVGVNAVEMSIDDIGSP